MKRNLTYKEKKFIKELSELLYHYDASITSINQKVTFFIDNVEEGDCVVSADMVTAQELDTMLTNDSADMTKKEIIRTLSEVKK